MNALKELRNKGYRITKPRQRVLETLYSHPATAEEIYKTLQKKKAIINLTSVYRTLQLFVKQNIVQEVEFGDGKKRYELTSENGHHHHIVCNSCGFVEDICPTDEEKMIQEATQKSHFQINKHTLEFFGICAECQ